MPTLLLALLLGCGTSELAPRFTVREGAEPRIRIEVRGVDEDEVVQGDVPPEALEETVLTNADLVGASVREDVEPLLVLHMTPQATRRLAAWSRDHVGEMIAVTLDGVPVSTPHIRKPFSNTSSIGVPVGERDVEDVARGVVGP